MKQHMGDKPGDGLEVGTNGAPKAVEVSAE